MAGSRPPGRRWILAGLRWGTVAVLSALLVLDLLFPPPLPQARDTSSVVVARDGTPLRAFADADGVWRHPAAPDTVSPLYLEALLTYEDRWFHRHPGINPAALARAGWQWLRAGRIVSGGSTLTMQVARILEPHSRTPWGKARQMLRALQLEARLSKAGILTLYLERAPFGGTIEGVEAASWAYLGKPASGLSRAEAALLAVLPQAPSRLRPDRHPERARAARDKLLERMVAQGAWTRAEVDDALIEPVVSRALRPPMHAALLAQRLRSADPRASRIDSTIDAGLQRALEERIAAYFAGLPERTSAALLVVDNATMEARVYIGAAEFGDRARLGHVDMVRAWRSPGSTLKPFLYAMALDDGLIHSASLMVDAPQSFDGYRPGNFGMAFSGPVSAGDALRQSLNVPAVDLLQRVGPGRFAARLDHAGIRLRFPRGAGPGLPRSRGGPAATREELGGAHAARVRGGRAGRVRLTAGAPLLERRLMSPGAAWIVAETLSSGPRPGERADLFDLRDRPRVAWKTGTSYGFRDAWALGATRAYTVGVWVGRPDGTPLPGQYGAITALPLLFDVIDSLPRQRGDALALPRPDSVREQAVCWPLGIAATDQPEALCRRRLDAWVLDGAIPPTFAERESRLWSAGRVRFQVDAVTGRRLSSRCSEPHRARDAELARWPALLSPWLGAADRSAARLPALAADCVDDGRERLAQLHIEGVQAGARLARAPGSERGVRLSLRTLGAQGRVQWLLDGRWLAQTDGQRPFVHEFSEPGRYTLTALADSGAWDRVEFQVLR